MDGNSEPKKNLQEDVMLKRYRNPQFVKSYETIKTQIEKIQAQYKILMNTDDFSDEMQAKLDRLDTIEVTLNWVLSDTDTDL